MNWVGIVVSGDKVILVHADVGGKEGPISIVADQIFKLQTGPRPPAYPIVFQQICKYLSDNKIEKVVIKASATSKSTTVAHLHAAELRGIVINAAAISCGDVVLRAKGVISKTFGDRKADEYIKDHDFWDDKLIGKNLRVGSREAALLLLAERDKL
ncbi:MULTISPECIES: hypothetical protein [unclassified Thalassospira]|uniref:hypothetical protein n=1 Tax=unclassified Thalassospira TaxID=2648997 RepID=UPI0007A5E73C|nr:MULTISPECIES: hypothetical protein [unclassified Thalassospira]KZC99432.1 hypothetical protein AUQ41_13145 [Thalassospira sp. MCCC 1A02898]ONH85547.1 hypothetical protein TH47_20350 [Thalassospira sp. MCCC 1A02803]